MINHDGESHGNGDIIIQQQLVTWFYALKEISKDGDTLRERKFRLYHFQCVKNTAISNYKKNVMKVWEHAILSKNEIINVLNTCSILRRNKNNPK